MFQQSARIGKDGVGGVGGLGGLWKGGGDCPVYEIENGV